MPIFEFRCICGTVFETYKHSHNDQNAKCPNCGKEVTKEYRVMSVTNFNEVDLRCQRIFGHDLKGRHTTPRK